MYWSGRCSSISRCYLLAGDILLCSCIECFIVRKSIKEGIYAVVKKFQNKPLLNTAGTFHCTIHKTNDHLCCPNNTKKKVTCCDDGAFVNDIKPLHHDAWRLEMVSDNLTTDQC